ncbi:hypothetical protein [Xanthobacter sp. ZOL 2024]
MSDQPPPAGHPPERAPRLARVPGLSRRLRAGLAARKRRTAGRFAAPTAWLPLALLGLMLICLSALAPVLFEGTPGAFDTGILAFYCGVLECMIIIRLGWPECYLDWMACGLFYMAFGGVLAGHVRLAALPRFALFATLFLACAFLRIWITLSLPLASDRDRGAGLLASALTGVFCGAWLIASRLVGAPGAPGVILAVDLMIYGVAVTGFGLSMRNKEP